MDTLTIQKDTIKTSAIDLQPGKQIVTEEFLDLVIYLDSSGFICDSARFAKTYQSISRTQQFNIDNYLFYDLKLAETVPIIEHMQHVERGEVLEKGRDKPDTAQQRWWQDWKERWELNIKLFEKAEKITAYFYVEKSLFDGSGNGTYYDGLIEEWKFPDTSSAKVATEELSRKETMVYVNRGAYVCYLGKHMYIFHSRSAGFYTPLKKFLTYFAVKNNATIPNKNKQRQNY